MRKLTHKKSFYLISALAVVVLITTHYNIAHALEVDLPGLSSTPTVGEYIAYIFNTVMQLAAVLAALVIAYGGALYLFSLGSKKYTSEGKEWIKAGVFGLILLMCSYLILYTINPNLISFKTTSLGLPIPVININTPPVGSGVPTVTYNEIPIGTLTENLLTRTTYCYDFDYNGDPIDGNINTAEWEPTLTNHDRVDCIVKISEAIKTKMKIISSLSEEIAKLMQTCKCTDEKCPNSCPPDGCQFTACPDGSCVGACVKAPCKGGDCCSPDVKQIIEHGPILVKTCAEDPGKEYKGLDEFRTNSTSFISVFEKDLIVDEAGEKVTYRIIQKDKWQGAKLIEQIVYLKEKLETFKKDIQTDLTALYTAEGEINGCYRVRSFLDFVNLKESTKPEDAKISLQKKTDPIENKTINSSKYCKGFDYSNSSCFTTCRKICYPTADSTVWKQIKGCAKNDTACIKNNFYACKSGSGFTNIQPCINDCRNACKSNCDKKYGACPEDNKKCKDACDNNSKAALEQDEKCLDFGKIKNCADNYQNFEDFKKCAESSTCYYSTDQYAGYPDCLKNYTGKDYSSSYLYNHLSSDKCWLDIAINKIIPNNTFFPMAKPECAKCPLFSKCPRCPCKNLACTDISADVLSAGADCAEFAYNGDPLTFYCRTDWQNEPLGLNINQSIRTGTSGGSGLTSEDKKDIEAEDMEEADKKELLQEETATSTITTQKLNCSKDKEIPVGEAVNQSEDWAKDLLKAVDDFVSKTNDAIQYLYEINNLAQSGDYCKCDSPCDSKGSCNTDCIFNQWLVPDLDADGNPTGTYHWECACNVQPCDGFACLKMINLLIGGACPDGGAESKGVPWHYDEVSKQFDILKGALGPIKRSECLKKLVYSREEMNKCSVNSNVFQLETQMVTCQIFKDYALDPISTWQEILNGKIYNRYCYGNDLGNIYLRRSLMDNWLCCQTLKR